MYFYVFRKYIGKLIIYIDKEKIYFFNKNLLFILVREGEVRLEIYRLMYFLKINFYFISLLK